MTEHASFGEDLVFTLQNPKSKMLVFAGALLLIAGLPFLSDRPDDQIAFAKIVCSPLLVAVAVCFLWRFVRLARTDKLELVVGSQNLRLPSSSGGAKSKLVALDEIQDVVRVSMRGKKVGIRFDLTAGRSHHLAGDMLDAELEEDIVRAVVRRVALRRNGVDSTTELGAAEAFLDAYHREGTRPFAVRVRGPGRKRRYTVLWSVDELADSAEKGAAYLPPDILALVSDSHVSGRHELRGVSAYEL